MGLHTYVESTGHEGMHPDDCYATEVATKHDGETVGFGSMQPGPDGEPDGWWGVLAATGRDLAIWANEEQEPDVD
jgi:hypothetical protein